MSVEYYGRDQLANVVPCLPRPPRWLVLGGPADGNEAQHARRLWPGVRVVGVEPNLDMVGWQLTAGGWPADQPLLHAALSDRPGYATVYLTPGRPRNGTLVRDADFAAPPRAEPVRTVTVDGLDGAYGPFEDALLWLDVEGWELEALRGAERALARGAVMACNVEMMDTFRAKNEAAHEILTRHGFRHVKDWNASAPCRDRVYVREGR